MLFRKRGSTIGRGCIRRSGPKFARCCLCNCIMLQYEKSSELDQEEISVHDLDKPDTMKRLPVVIIFKFHLQRTFILGTAV